jgi:carbon monoxide dehydrogenase subunit G
MRWSLHPIRPVLLACLLALPAAATPVPPARDHGAASRLSAAERDILMSGRIVSRPSRLTTKNGEYVGGVSYMVVRATPEEVLAALQDVSSLPDALPQTKSAKLLDTAGNRARVELVQGGKMIDARYTVHIERVPGKDELKFWLDHSRQHDIKDVWGFFRVQPFGKGQTLLTVGAMLDLGPGLARMLFEDRIQGMILRAPRKIRDYIEPRALARN